MRIAELFHSIQGEGKLAGVPSTFIRTAGCNLACRWCDTEYALSADDGESMSVAQVIAVLADRPTRHVVVTGGEPMIQPDIVELTQALRERGPHITVETSGTVFKPVACDLMSISPKLSNSTPRGHGHGPQAQTHESRRIDVDCLLRLMARCDYQLKFVVACPEDLGEIRQLLDRLGEPEPDNVLLMPEGTSHETLAERAGWVIEMCKETGFRYCPRLHIDVFGNRRGH